MRIQPSTINAFGVLAASAMLLICGEVSAQTIIPLDQQRSVNTFLIVPQCLDKTFDEDSAKGFEPFDSVVETLLGCDSGFGFGSASQQSQIGASSMTCSVIGTAEAGGPVPDVIHAFGYSIFQVTFELPSLSRFDLDGTMTAGSFPDANVGTIVLASGSFPDANVGTIVLARLWEGRIGDVLLFEQSVEPPPGGGTNNQALEAAGALEPGVYTLDVQAGSFIEGNDVPPSRSGQASFAFTFDVTILGDLNEDGTVGIVDLLLLLAAWGPCADPCPPTCAADLDADCDVGILDFLRLLANWS